MRKRMTVRAVAEAIAVNCNAYHERRIDYEAFSAEQNRLWRYADSRSRRFVDGVSRCLMGKASA